MKTKLGLYIHIPFCRAKCKYCDFYSVAPPDEGLMNDYAAAVRAHLREAAAFAEGYAVGTVYFGGGTPTLLGAPRLTAILREIEKRFEMAHSVEVTLECNPESTDFRLLKKLNRAGFNRLSIGVQSLDDKHLQALGRLHTAAEAKACVEEARRAGFDNLSVDLMYGLPGQTREHWLRTLLEVCAWSPEHLSCYGLKLEPGTPLYIENPALPDEDAQADMYLDMVRILEEQGYAQYEISNFCKRSRESRHNLKYWLLEPYLGFGPGAHSDFSGRRYSYRKDVEGYIRGIQTGGEIIDEMELCPPSERAGEYVMLGLRTAHGLSSNEYTRQFGVSFDRVERILEACRKRGLAVRQNDRWRLTPEGFLLSNRIIAELLEPERSS